MKRNRLALLVVAAGAAVGSAAQAQTVINITGATLFENFFNKPASTNDYWDVDGDGFARRFLTDDSLCPDGDGLPAVGSPTFGQNGDWWVINYRVNGSVTGFQELVDFSSTFVTNADGPTAALSSSLNSKAYLNRTLYVNAGVGTGNFNAANPGGCPIRSNPATLFATQPGVATDALRIDIAPLDVPSTWAVRTAGTTAYSRLPGQAGYGSNARKQRTVAGVDIVSSSNLLASLAGRNLNVSAPDSNTIFDTAITAVPISAIVNQGVGRSQITQSELSHLFVTGRMPSGENLTAITREVGSGTRNGFMNSLGVDPSWGVGEGVGGISADAEVAKVGPLYVPGNRIGSGDLEAQLFNTRLSVGYTGSERSLSNGITPGKCEVLAVKMDLEGGSAYFRPTISNIVNNSTPNSYRIGGVEQFATLGDPQAAAVTPYGGFANGHPGMFNIQAAAYINNITRSVAAFDANPGSNENLFTPGELLAKNFVLVAAADFSQSATDGTNWSGNPVFNANVKTYTIANNVLRLMPTTFGSVTLDGKVPTRRTTGAPVYTDTGIIGSDTFANTNGTYISESGAHISYGVTITSRNRVQGDFSGNGVRDINDVADMVAAYKKRQGTGTWTAPNGTGAIAGASGGDAIIEVLGDFNNDGNFNARDIRFFADGLALNGSGNLDRKAGFTAVDTAFGGNLFGTTLVAGVNGPRAYKYGDSRADIAGAAGTTPGWAPVGNDGVVNGTDITYIMAQYRAGDVDWKNNLSAAALADLSADVNGDLIIDRADVTEVLQNVLCTRWWDVNLDGVINQDDRDIATAHLGQSGGWAQGDVDGDGVITAADVSLICGADFNGDGAVDFFDYLDFVDAFSSGACYADVNADSVIDFFDYLDFVDVFSSGC